MKDLFGLSDTMVAVAVTLAVIAALLVVRGVAFRLMSPLFDGQRRQVRGIIRGVTRVPSVFWCVALGLMAGLSEADIPKAWAASGRQAIGAFLIASAVVALANLGEGLARYGLERHGNGVGDAGIVRGAIRAVVYGIGLLVLLSHVGVQIGPLLTAFGIGGLAVALAFKDTFENLFSGIHLVLDRSIEVGDLIKLESGQEGHVKDIGWRTSKLTLPDDAMLIIPNAKLAQSIVIVRAKHPLTRAQRVEGAGVSNGALSRVVPPSM